MKRIRILIAAAALALSGGALGVAASAAPASAAAAPVHASIAGQQHRSSESDTPATTCPRYSGAFTTWLSGCTHPIEYACAPNSGTIRTPSYVSNGCSTRVWIYETGVRAGYNLCISPNSSTGLLKRSYAYLWASTNTASC